MVYILEKTPTDGGKIRKKFIKGQYRLRALP